MPHVWQLHQGIIVDNGREVDAGLVTAQHASRLCHFGAHRLLRAKPPPQHVVSRRWQASPPQSSVHKVARQRCRADCNEGDDLQRDERIPVGLTLECEDAAIRGGTRHWMQHTTLERVIDRVHNVQLVCEEHDDNDRAQERESDPP